MDSKRQRQIRHLDRQDIKDMPIIAMSANAFAEDVRLSLEAGMNEHISKTDRDRQIIWNYEEMVPVKKPESLPASPNSMNNLLLLAIAS